MKVWENGVETEREIEFFGWEKLDAVELIRKSSDLRPVAKIGMSVRMSRFLCERTY
ncbi:MAG: hypothetical protein ACLRM8_04320 [Alistipes sp.]